MKTIVSIAVVFIFVALAGIAQQQVAVEPQSSSETAPKVPYRIVGTISDVHASKLAAGMRAHVKIDETTTIEGTISSIDPRIENGVAKFYVTLDRRAHPRLRNNLRVDVLPVLGSRGNVLRVRRGALGQGDHEDVFVIRGNVAVRTPVRWGLAGDEVIQPIDGLREGDEVVISNMSEFQGLKELRLK